MHEQHSTPPTPAQVRGLSWTFDEATGTYTSTRPLDSNDQFRELARLSDDARVAITGDGFAEIKPPSIPDGHGGRIYSGTIHELEDESEVDNLIRNIHTKKDT